MNQPIGQILELLVQLLPDACGLCCGAEMQPVAFDGMNHTHPDHGFATGHGGGDTGEMVFYQTEILPPGGLIADGCRIVTLGFALHGNEGQMGHTERCTQCGLPVALELIAAEIVIPAGDAVQLRHHAFPVILPDGGLALLGGGVFHVVAQNVDAGQLEGTVAAHGFAQSAGLAVQRGLQHHVTGQQQVVLAAPTAALVCKGFGEALADVVVIMVTGGRYLTVGQIPQ